ncbi:hypothetical protein [Blastococcus sp. SYSU DS1024]
MFAVEKTYPKGFLCLDRVPPGTPVGGPDVARSGDDPGPVKDGNRPKIRDAELITLAVVQALAGRPSETR